MSYQILPYHNPDSNNYKDLKPLMLTTSPSDLKGRSALGLLPLLTSNTDSVLWPNYAFTLALVRCLPRHVQDYLFCNREGQDVHDLACMADKEMRMDSEEAKVKVESEYDVRNVKSEEQEDVFKEECDVAKEMKVVG